MNYTIKEVSKKFNLSSHTLRYYEKEGLLPSINRDSKGNRVYSDNNLEWIQLICCMRATGMSISHIKKYIQLTLQGDDTILERRQIILNQKEIIENHIKEFNHHLHVINKKLKFYDDIAISDQKIVYPKKSSF
ncbi:MAG: MerR family transcriptional regulator [Eubacteriaceae bacterium]